MDKEALQRQLEDMEEASERWRAERRRMNAEIDKLEAALAEAKADAARKQSIAQKSQAADSRTLARVQEAAEQKLKKASEEWEAERTKLTSKVNRLEGALAEAIARASNPLRVTQSVKEQFELELNRVAKEKTELEQAFLRAKSEWEQEKLKLTGEMVKLRRNAQIMGRPVLSGTIPEVNPKVRDLENQMKEQLAEWTKEREQLSGKLHKMDEAGRQWDAERRQLSDHAGQLQQALTAAQATIQTFEHAAKQPHPAEEQLDESRRELEAARNLLQQARQAAETETNTLTNRIAGLEAQLQESIKRGEAAGTETREGWEAEQQRLTSEIERLERELQSEAEGRAQAGMELRHAWETEKRHLTGKIGELQKELQDLTDKRDQVHQEIVNQLRQQYEQRLQEAIAQRTQMTDQLQQAGAIVQAEGGDGALNTQVIQSEIARVESVLHEIVAVIENPDTELGTVIKKNVEKAELEAYLKGILFSLGK